MIYLSKYDNLKNFEFPDERPNSLLNYDGTISSHPQFWTSGIIPVSGFVTFNGEGAIYNLSFFDAQDEVISYTYSADPFFIEVPKNTIYMRYCLPMTTYDGYNYVIKILNKTTPIYKEDLALETELESEQRFYRTSLSGELTFVRKDYDYIINSDFETQFQVLVIVDNEQIYSGRFFKTDCTINEYDRYIKVKPEAYDVYNDVLAGLEKEYDLVKLKPTIQALTITKRPLIQIYKLGDSIVSCFLSGMHWEQDCTVVTDENALVNTYRFNKLNSFIEIEVTGSGSIDVSGTYAAEVDNVGNPKYWRTDGIYYIDFRWTPDGIDWRISSPDSVFLYTTGLEWGDNRLPTGELVFNAKAEGVTGSFTSLGTEIKLYARYICDVDEALGEVTYPIPANDIVDNNRNYRRVLPYDFDVASLSTNLTDEQTEWGKNDNGQYYLPPDNVNAYYPIGRTSWNYISYWFAFYFNDWLVERFVSKEYVLKDTYELSSCISVLLAQFSSIEHKNTAEYSEFLYGTNPISDIDFRLFISQKTNLINGEYQTPAQTAPITLQDITNMLRDVYKCYWFIEDNKFKIEHIEWFRNGGSYTSSGIVGIDYTTLENKRNGKKWAFNTSEYTFDKIDLAERYEFKWMDDVEETFKGEPIEVLSNYVTAGKVEEINVSNFTSDIDLMLLNPSAINSDGFVLFGAVDNELPFIDVNVDGVKYTIQNGYCAYSYILPRFWARYDMPAKKLKVNGKDFTPLSISRKKKQELKAPMPLNFNPMQLVKTYLGNGEVEKIALNLSDLTAEINLKYDTE